MGNRIAQPRDCRGSLLLGFTKGVALPTCVVIFSRYFHGVSVLLSLSQAEMVFDEMVELCSCPVVVPSKARGCDL